MRKFYIVLIAGIFGLISSLILPNGFKFFSFIIPLFLFCIAFSPDENYFSINLFVGMLLFYVILSSSFITFDASEPLNFIAIRTFMYTLLDVFTVLVFIGVPIVMIVAMIYAFIIGQVSQFTESFIRIIIVIVLLIGVFFVMDVAGVQFAGNVMDFVKTFYISIGEFLINLPLNIYTGIDNLLPDWIVDLPPIPSQFSGVDLDNVEVGEASEAVVFDALWVRFSSMSYTNVVLTIHDSLPIIMSLICLVSAIAMSKKDWEVLFVDKLNNWGLDEVNEVLEKKSKFIPNLNYTMIFFMIFLLISAFAIGLSYSNVFPTGMGDDWRMIIYLSVYLFMSIVPLIFLNRNNSLYYRRSTPSNTLKGTVYGLAGLILMTRLFFQRQLMDAFSVQELGTEISYVIFQFVFVAPSESLMFHVFIPSVVGGLLLAYTVKNVKRGYELDRDVELGILDARLEMLGHLETFYKSEKKPRQLAEVLSDLNDAKQDKRDLEDIEYKEELDYESIFGRASSLTIFCIIGVVVPAFIFSMLHWIVQIPSGMDFFIFWGSGLGIIFFAGSVWFTFISYQYGWLSCILTHAINNSFTILLVIIFAGI